MKKIKLKLIKLVSYIIGKYYLGDTKQSEWIVEKYQNLSSIFANILNQLCYILRLPYSYRLTSLVVEITNRCNLKCIMCSHHKGMKRAPKDLEFNLLKKIISDTHRYIETICISHVGEPFINPDIFKIIDYIKKNGQRVIIFTNGTLLNEEKMLKLLQLKVDVLNFSIDGSSELYESIRGWSYDDIKKKVLKFVELRNKFNKDTKVNIVMVIFEENEKEIKNFTNYWEKFVDAVKYLPRILEYKGNQRERHRKICRELWRGNLVITSSGNIVCCCVDYDEDYILGNVSEQKLKDIWNCEKLRSLRKRHLKRDFPDGCKRCDEYQSSLCKPRLTR